MRHRKNGKKLSRTSAHRKALNRNLTRSLILHGRIKTTITKAKEVIPFASRLVTLAKDGSLAARRRAISLMGEDDAVGKLFGEIGPRFADRPGGYLRIIKLPVGRLGDRAEQAFLEFVEEEAVEEEEPTKKKRKQKKLSKKAKREQAKKERKKYDLEKKRAEAAQMEAEESEEPAEGSDSSRAEAAPDETEPESEAAEAVESEQPAQAEESEKKDEQ